MENVVLITGASSGLGKACAERLSQRGHRVYGTSRRAPEQGEQRNGITMLNMDVDQDASVRQGVERILERERRIDVAINCAGYILGGAIENTPIDVAKAHFETNFFGTMRVCQAVLPAMRAQRSGLIVNISSVGGLFSLPFHGVYGATKFAVEGLSEALSIEVKPFGVRVVIVEPGDYRTNLTANRRRVDPDPAYAKNMHNAIGVMEHDEMNGADPEQMARLVERIVNSRSPRLRYITGPLYETAAVVLKRILPARLFEWILAKYCKLEGVEV
jgi:NAD(P)-dependent dehydrogenase (short-subunit alcohol dehydrogenase family)